MGPRHFVSRLECRQPKVTATCVHVQSPPRVNSYLTAAAWQLQTSLELVLGALGITAFVFRSICNRWLSAGGLLPNKARTTTVPDNRGAILLICLPPLLFSHSYSAKCCKPPDFEEPVHHKFGAHKPPREKGHCPAQSHDLTIRFCNRLYVRS